MWNDKPYLIAEIGSNHDGDKARALALIRRAADVGADAVKFQLFRAETMVVADHPAFETLANLSTPLEWLPELASRCRELSIDFAATPFDLAAVEALAASEPAFIKVSSSDVTYLALLRAAAKTGAPLLLSTGMSTMEDVARAVDTCKRAGARQLALLHCVSLYPTPAEAMHLRAIETMAARFDLPVGLSDHSPGVAIAAAALALGARIIEKHVTDDRRRPGPDHSYALEFDQFAQLVEAVRMVPVALGDGEKRARGAERQQIRRARRGLYARRAIAAGEPIDGDAIVALRPQAAVNAEDIDRVCGKRAPEALAPGDPLPASLLLSHED